MLLICVCCTSRWSVSCRPILWIWQNILSVNWQCSLPERCNLRKQGGWICLSVCCGLQWSAWFFVLYMY